jgi:penicillin amidase
MVDDDNHDRQAVSRRDVLKAGTAAAGAAGLATTGTQLAYAESDGQSTTVTIKRDEYGVPHIYAREAEGRAPTFFGYGYATAEDRLYQLDLYRRYYRGTVAAVFGEDWIDFDIAARQNTAGEPSLDEQAEDQLTASQRDVLQAFTDGINRYITEVRERDDWKFHRGFHENDFEPSLFSTADTAGMFVGSMAFFSGFQLETLGANVVDLLTAETGSRDRAMELFHDCNWGNDPGAPTSTVQPDVGYTPPFTKASFGSAGSSSFISAGSSSIGPRVTGHRLLPNDRLVSPLSGLTLTARPERGTTGRQALRSNRLTGGDVTLPSDPASVHEAEMDRIRTLAQGLDELGLPIKYGSNALAVQGDVTASGDALLFGGPQMGFNTPSIMHEAGLHGPDFDVAGSTVAGYPFIMFGRNREGAFTSTAGIDNCIQTFVESITTAESGPDTYTFRGEEYPIETDKESIHVAGAENVTHTQRFTRHGIVTQWNPDEDEAIAQTRSYAGRHMNCWRAFYECQFAADAEEFTEAAQRCDYALNFMWADKTGDISYVHLGRYPDSEVVGWDTRFPADGTQHELTADDYLRAAEDEVPFAINPAPGYAAQWNNKPAPDWNNGDLSYSWSTDHRVQRIINLVEHRLDTEGVVDYAFLKEIVHDIAFVDLRSIRYKDHLLDALADADLTETERQARAELESWNHYREGTGEDETGKYPAGYTVWDATFPKILQEVFAESFGAAYEPASYFLDYDYGRGTLMRVLNPEATALPLGAEYVGDDPDDELVSAFKAAVAALAEEYDGEPSTWRKSVRVEEFDNMALFGMPTGVTQAGEMAWVNRGTENHFVRLSDDPTAENVLPPGNDGYVAPDGSTTDDYADQLGLFKDFEYKQLRYDDGAVAAATRSTRTLTRDRPAPVPESDTTYYQIDLVVGEPIEELRGPEGTYTSDQLLRFLHGSTDEPVTRRSDGEFVTDDAVADRIETRPIEVAGDTARTTFAVADGEPVTLTLASYEKTGPGWSPETESEQVFVDSHTRTFESGTHTLTVDLPW